MCITMDLFRYLLILCPQAIDQLRSEMAVNLKWREFFIKRVVLVDATKLRSQRRYVIDSIGT